MRGLKLRKKCNIELQCVHKMSREKKAGLEIVMYKVERHICDKCMYVLFRLLLLLLSLFMTAHANHKKYLQNWKYLCFE